MVPVGAVVWVAAVRPGFLPSWAAQLSEVGWGGGLIGLIAVIIRGRICGKKARRLAAEPKPPDSRPERK